MSMNYRLADMIARLKNGQQARHAQVTLQYSQFLANVLDVLKGEGFITDWRKTSDDGKNSLEVDLKYSEGERVIREFEVISKPGRRVYAEISKLPKFNNGLGIAILSTSKGVMSDFDARQANVGGEVLCSVF